MGPTSPKRAHQHGNISKHSEVTLTDTRASHRELLEEPLPIGLLAPQWVESQIAACSRRKINSLGGLGLREKDQGKRSSRGRRAAEGGPR